CVPECAPGRPFLGPGIMPFGEATGKKRARALRGPDSSCSEFSYNGLGKASYNRLAPPQLVWPLVAAQVAEAPVPAVQGLVPEEISGDVPLPAYEENWHPPVKGAPSSILRSISAMISTGTWLPDL